MIKVLYNTVNITEKKAHIVKYSQQITELKKKKNWNEATLCQTSKMLRSGSTKKGNSTN